MKIIWWIVIIIAALLIVPQILHPDTVRDIRNYIQTNIIEKIVYKEGIDMGITCSEIDDAKGFLNNDFIKRTDCLKECAAYDSYDASWGCPENRFTCYCK